MIMHPRTAEAILSSVKYLVGLYPSYSVTIVGHSLGGALALLDGVSLILQSVVGPNRLRVITYGMPRVGNQAFANLVDRQLIFEPNLMHVNNREDPIPVMPDRPLGYHHPSGEIHIQDSGALDACPGAFLLSALSLSKLSFLFLRCVWCCSIDGPLTFHKTFRSG
jgi:predicted lipase